VSIDKNNSLETLEGLDGLVEAGNGLHIGGLEGNPSLASLSGLENLQEVNGFLYIGHNDELSDISALEDVDPATIWDLHIKYNTSLSVCSITSLCEFLEFGLGYIAISDNAPGCDSPEEVLDDCGALHTGPETKQNTHVIFPNPTDGIVHLPAQEGLLPMAIAVYDLCGSKVYSTMDPKESVDLSHLPGGMYFMLLAGVDGNTIFSCKILLQ
jgi:hypothetical protein